MNVYESEIMNILCKEHFVNQRILAETTGHSIGSVNKSLRQLAQDGYLDNNMQFTDKGRQEIRAKAPRNAIILAAGFGMRMVPINTSTPKALLEVNGEPLIERTIRQLHEVGITNITVVVGVDLAVNSEYSKRNNLHSLAYVAGRIDNSYIIPCDIWCAVNPYSRTEPYSWYMVSDKMDEDSTVRVNRKRELVMVSEKEAGNAMIGIAYLTGREAQIVRENLRRMDTDEDFDDEFWERALYGERDRMILQAKTVSAQDFVEINTYEQLRELDSGSNHLQSDAIMTICEALGCGVGDIKDISILKKGMTNRSFLFSVKGAKYIMRIPGEGTDRLINRRQEAEVYKAISGLGLCDDPVYINPDNGYKITSFLENVRVCDPSSEEDLRRCMKKLRSFHEMQISVGHTFDIYGQIEFYESLWDGAPSIYRDYLRTKEKVLSLRGYVEGLEHDWCLTHIDAVPDNFLFYRPVSEDAASGADSLGGVSGAASLGGGSGADSLGGGSGADSAADVELLQLTDWEYAGMQDPHVDIAMFCIYSLYNRQECDRLIDIYFEGRCNRSTRTKIYIYIAMCGLLWSNWCEYKRKLGVEFGEYNLRQYRYAKDFYRAAKEMMEAAESSASASPES